MRYHFFQTGHINIMCIYWLQQLSYECSCIASVAFYLMFFEKEKFLKYSFWFICKKKSYYFFVCFLFFFFLFFFFFFCTLGLYVYCLQLEQNYLSLISICGLIYDSNMHSHTLFYIFSIFTLILFPYISAVLI